MNNVFINGTLLNWTHPKKPKALMACLSLSWLINTLKKTFPSVLPGSVLWAEASTLRWMNDWSYRCDSCPDWYCEALSREGQSKHAGPLPQSFGSAVPHWAYPQMAPGNKYNGHWEATGTEAQRPLLHCPTKNALLLSPLQSLNSPARMLGHRPQNFWLPNSRN